MKVSWDAKWDIRNIILRLWEKHKTTQLNNGSKYGHKTNFNFNVTAYSGFERRWNLSDGPVMGLTSSFQQVTTKLGAGVVGGQETAAILTF